MEKPKSTWTSGWKITWQTQKGGSQAGGGEAEKLKQVAYPEKLSSIFSQPPPAVVWKGVTVELKTKGLVEIEILFKKQSGCGGVGKMRLWTQSIWTEISATFSR